VRETTEFVMFQHACLGILVPALTLAGCSGAGYFLPHSFGVMPALAFSSNPGYVEGNPEGAVGAAVTLNIAAGDLAVERLGYSAQIKGETFGGGSGEHFIEADAELSVDILSYAVSRRVRPHGVDLTGLHPRTIHTAAFNLRLLPSYAYTVTARRFDEPALRSSNSDNQTHVVGISTYDFLVSLGPNENIDLAFWYQWTDVDHRAANDYKSEGGCLLVWWSAAEHEESRGQPLPLIPADADVILDSMIWTAGWGAVLGWSNMYDFEGPIGDPNTDPPWLLGGFFASVRRGNLASGLLLFHRPEPSDVSNYQIRAAAYGGLGVELGEESSLVLKLGYETADRSLGPDLTLVIGSVRYERVVRESWHLATGLRWEERDSDVAGGHYQTLSLCLGLRWLEGAAGP
jgi:hypothetical protein